MYFIGVFTPKKAMSILRNTFEGTRGKAIAGGLAAMMAVASLGGVAHAQDIASNNPNVTNASTAPTATPQGKPVIFRVGPGFSIGEANVMAAFLESKGCPTTVKSDGFIPDSVDVEVSGDIPENFESVGSAGSFALDKCRAEL